MVHTNTASWYFLCAKLLVPEECVECFFCPRQIQQRLLSVRPERERDRERPRKSGNESEKPSATPRGELILFCVGIFEPRQRDFVSRQGRDELVEKSAIIAPH